MSPLWFMAFISLGVLSAWLLMVAVHAASEARFIRRINAWSDTPSRRWTDGGSLTWMGERR